MEITTLSTLNLAQFLFIIIELSLLAWTMIITLKKSTKKNRPTQFFATKIVASCAILTILYGIDLSLDFSVVNVIITALWGVCTWVWWKILKNLPKKHKAEDELEKIKLEIDEHLAQIENNKTLLNE